MPHTSCDMHACACVHTYGWRIKIDMHPRVSDVAGIVAEKGPFQLKSKNNRSVVDGEKKRPKRQGQGATDKVAKKRQRLLETWRRSATVSLLFMSCN